MTSEEHLAPGSGDLGLDFFDGDGLGGVVGDDDPGSGLLLFQD